MGTEEAGDDAPSNADGTAPSDAERNDAGGSILGYHTGH